MLYYFDSSAVVKRYAPEQGSDWIKQVVADTHNTVYISDIGIVEIAAALSKKVRTGELEQADGEATLLLFLHDLDQQDYVLTPFRSELVPLAVELTTRHPLRGYDAVQLATALSLYAAINSDTESSFAFVSADAALCAAARGEGLVVEQPTAKQYMILRSRGVLWMTTAL